MASYSTIKNGSSGNDVKTWQNYLKSQGYDIGSTGADGVFGSKTLAATKQYQKDNGLAVDGIVGKNTWASMTSNTAKTNATKTNNAKTNTTTENVKSAAQKAVTSGANAALGSVSVAPNGVSQNQWNEALSDFSGSKELDNLYKESMDAYGNAKDVLSQDEIIDQATKDKMNKELVFSDAYYQAMDVMNAKLQELTDGKTKWTDQYEAAMNNYLNREDFEYDVDKDPLFQQALASAMNSGKSAMQDTIGQASALTGGYGSTYATSAGNQAYNAFIEDAYNNLPEYYNMALQAYQAEGQEMYNQVAMLGEADANEFQREYTEWQASFDNANNLWNQEFNTWQAETNQAYNSANIQLQEYGQKAENAYNLYNMASSQYESMYAKEFDNWQARINQLFNSFEIQNSDWWSQTNFDKTFNASYTKNSDGTYSPKGNTGNGSNGNGENWTQSEYSNANAKYENGGEEALTTYAETIGRQQGWSTTTIDNFIDAVIAGGNMTNTTTTQNTDMKSQDFWNNVEITKTKDTINWFLGSDDYDDEVKINGKVYTLKQVHEMLGEAGFDGKTKDAFIKKLSELDKDTVYTWKNGVKSSK